MLVIAAFLIGVGAVTPAGGRLDSKAWVKKPARPSADERRCTDYSSLFWSVAASGGSALAVEMTTREHLDPVPFSYAAGPDRQGSRYAARAGEGWLVGFDAGEFGGGLWWFSDGHGQQGSRIRPRPSSPTNPADIYHAENVLGLPRVGGQQLVLMGLDHLGARSGRVFRIVAAAGAWSLEPVAVLDAEPAVWLLDGSRLLFLTDSGLWSSDGLSAHKVHPLDVGGFAPTSMVQAADGGLYVGMRYYVLRLAEEEGRWTESWFAPASCLSVRLRDYDCDCVR